jgi:Curli production assembly/transport component CsgG
MSHPLRFATLLLATAALAAPLRADPATGPAADATLAIAGIEARSGATQDQAALVADLLTATLVNEGKLRVVERAQIARVMKEQALANSGAMSDEVQIKLAQLVGARWLLLGALQAEGRGFIVSGRAIDSSTAQIAFADSVKVATADQLSAGARQLARKLQDKLTGSKSAQTSGEAVGDFDPAQIKEAARQLARLLAVRFPKVQGKLKEVLPNGTSSCRFADPRQAFVNQRFIIGGIDSVTGQAQEKGIFLLKVLDEKGGCSGRYKSSGADEISDGDTISSVTLKVSMDPLRAGPGTDPEMGKVFSDESRESLKNQGAFDLTGEAQVALVGSISGSKGHRVIEVQALEKGGAVIQRWDLTGTF